MRMVMVDGCFPPSFWPESPAFSAAAAGFAPDAASCSFSGAAEPSCSSARRDVVPSVSGASPVWVSTFFSPLLSPMSLTCP